MWGKHPIAHWSRTQATIALSSGEAELNAALKGGVELLGAGTMVEELGANCALVLRGDSAASKGILSREGAGRLKHISVRQLWMQDIVANRGVSIEQIPRAINTGDAFTKHWGPDGPSHFARMQVVIL